MRLFAWILTIIALCYSPSTLAEDAANCSDHPALERYPDSVLQWCKTDNYLPYKIPVGPVTGYRTIGEWVETEGRVTRNFYSLSGERTHPEVWKNYKDALAAAGFTIIAEGMLPERNVKGTVGGGTWLGIYYTSNPWGSQGQVNKLVKGTSSSGGTGVVFGMKERADDTLYVLVSLEQHSAQEVAALITVIETKAAETGRVTANAEAIGKDIQELGRTVLDGLYFEHDKAALMPESTPALAEIAKFLTATGEQVFYVVGHTDATGEYSYNVKLSRDRAMAVREALIENHGITPARLQAEGVGPLVPVFTNKSDGGRSKNRRVELVER